MKACFHTHESEGKLNIGILTNLSDSLLIGQAKPLIDEQSTKRNPDGLCRGYSC